MRNLFIFGSSFVVVAACGGEAVIDPPLGSGGSGSSSNASNQSSSGSFGVTVTTSSTGSGMQGCNELNQTYRDLVAAAKQCNADIPMVQCQDIVPDDLFCPCETSVDLSGAPQLAEAIASVVNTFVEQGCLETPPPCPPVACLDIVAPDCVNDVCRDQP